MTINESAYNELKSFLKDELMKSWQAAGHYMTGKVIDSIEFFSEQQADAFLIQMAISKIGVYQDRGVAAANIPFSGIGGGGKSKYIEGLRNYAEKRMSLSGKQALSAAFAIAYTQKKEGMQIWTKGQGTKWFSNTLEQKEPLIIQRLNQIFTKAFRFTIENRINGMIKEFNK